VLVLLFTVGMGSGTSVMYSQFLAVAKQGAAAGKNTNIKKVVFVGNERLEGEFYTRDEGAKLPEDLDKQLRSGRGVSVLVPGAEIRSGRVTELLKEYAVPFGRQEETGAWIPQLLMLLLPALILLAIFFFFLLPRFRDPLGGGFLSNYIKSPAKRYEKNKMRVTF